MGGGGHTREILARLGEGGKLYSLDQDPDAQANAPQDEHFEFVASNFRFVRGAISMGLRYSAPAKLPRKSL